MKKLIFPAVAALTLGLASCSSDEVNPGNGGGQPSFAQGGYAKVAINLPSRSGSNRGNNDDFEDGLASEYKVNTAKLILFSGDSEANATFHSAYKINVAMEGVNDDTPNQITSTTKIVQKVNDNGNVEGKNLYALVVLNDNDLLSVSDDHKLSLQGSVTHTGNFTGNLDALQTEIVSATEHYGKIFTDKGFLMTNAPLSVVKGGATTEPTRPAVTPTNTDTRIVKTLVNFTGAVYKTEAEAQSKPATEIFVERAVGKVTLTAKTGQSLKATDLVYDGTPGTKPTWEVKAWDLDVTNKSSYLVRNTKDSYDWHTLKSKNVNNYRFIGENEVKTGCGYRTYWAIDPNYGALNTETPAYSFRNTLFNYLSSTATIAGELGSDHPKYCFENTFDVAHQKQQETTRAIVKVKIGNGTFYTINGDKSHLYTETTRNARLVSTIVNEPKVVEWVSTKGGFKTTAADKGVTIDNATGFTKNADTNALTLEKFKVTSADGTEKEFAVGDILDMTKPENTGKTLNDALGLGTILEYTGGYAYYPIRIKHFGAELTPWNTETSAPGDDPTPQNVYPVGSGSDQANNYLGRYGVLRNNWYDLEVTGITALGEPVVPSVDKDDSADDELYNYIAVRINVLSWAKRQQKVEL